ncbi:CDC5 cell division cycle 5-like protein [Gaertneriomyces sp. JEL0708]|nr:CDC5 cell division cycle 5-like protein [Gaertneriomyces sp. JEL0708]
MRILVKGGVWKNTEDEILKAAVMKYGKNQWARISSLLTRKTPKQCKARWYEWLDPSIKKTEWSKDEDETLLHMAKLMPTQWRTIAPIVGRTPSQCLERYQKLLDEAEAREDEGEAGPSGDDVRRLRPGEIDPDPETKPARPDPVDMDEDEKEMLSEARARLANTQGKKAKRKAREKQLEEARRLAALQKRRELKAAGIDIKFKRKTRGIDYNADIPLYKKTPAGFWDVNDEKDREEREKPGMTNVLLQKLEGKRRVEIEEMERKKDAKRQKTKKEQGEYVPNVVSEPELIFSERRPLQLPSPQIGENELAEIVKLGASGEHARAVVDSDEGTATRGLLAEYSTSLRSTAATPSRAIRTPAVGDRIMAEARNLRAMESAQTPLLGHDVELEGSVTFTPASQRPVTQTPNPLAQIAATPRLGGASVSATPRAGADAFLQTPLRDQMGINTPRSSGFGFDETPRGGRQRQALIRQQLADGFKSLPTPKNDFEIVLPDAKADTDGEGKRNLVEDAGDVEQRELAAKKAEREAAMRKRSTVVQRDLPRPFTTPSALSGGVDEITRALNDEMLSMMNDDATGNINMDIEEDELLHAAELIKSELASLERTDIEEDFDELHEKVWKEYLFSPSQGKYVRRTDLSSDDRIAIFQQTLTNNRQTMASLAARAQKLEKKLGVILGGHQTRSVTLRRDLASNYREWTDKDVERETFRSLRRLEERGAEQRIALLEKEVRELQLKERDVQDRYGELQEEKATLTQALANGVA